jgi:hypothetical protein
MGEPPTSMRTHSPSTRSSKGACHAGRNHQPSPQSGPTTLRPRPHRSRRISNGSPHSAPSAACSRPSEVCCAVMPAATTTATSKWRGANVRIQVGNAFSSHAGRWWVGGTEMYYTASGTEGDITSAHKESSLLPFPSLDDPPCVCLCLCLCLCLCVSVCVFAQCVMCRGMSSKPPGRFPVPSLGAPVYIHACEDMA